MPWTPWGEQALASLLTSDELALLNGRRQHERWQKRYDAWAAKNPEQAERNAKVIADFQAATAAERAAILAQNKDTPLTDEDRRALYDAHPIAA